MKKIILVGLCSFGAVVAAADTTYACMQKSLTPQERQAFLEKFTQDPNVYAITSHYLKEYVAAKFQEDAKCKEDAGIAIAQKITKKRAALLQAIDQSKMRMWNTYKHDGKYAEFPCTNQSESSVINLYSQVSPRLYDPNLVNFYERYDSLDDLLDKLKKQRKKEVYGAIEQNKIKRLQQLIQWGHPINQLAYPSDVSPLEMAAMYGRFEIVQFLLKQKQKLTDISDFAILSSKNPKRINFFYANADTKEDLGNGSEWPLVLDVYPHGNTWAALDYAYAGLQIYNGMSNEVRMTEEDVNRDMWRMDPVWKLAQKEQHIRGKRMQEYVSLIILLKKHNAPSRRNKEQETV